MSDSLTSTLSVGWFIILLAFWANISTPVAGVAVTVPTPPRFIVGRFIVMAKGLCSMRSIW